MFNLEFSSQSKKFLKKGDTELCGRILDKIKLLKDQPVPHDAKRIIGEKSTFRIRVGNYRVLYKIYWEDNKILVAVIDKRDRIYH